MHYVIWRARVTYWFRRRSGMPLLEAWHYSGHMRDFFTDEYSGPCDPREAVDIEISYWEH
jgi:hypothetical protein